MDNVIKYSTTEKEEIPGIYLDIQKNQWNPIFHHEHLRTSIYVSQWKQLGQLL